MSDATPTVTLADHLNTAVNAETLRNEYRYLWLRRRIAGTIIHRIDPSIEDVRPEKLDEIIDGQSGPCPSLTSSRLASETAAQDAPAEMRITFDSYSRTSSSMNLLDLPLAEAREEFERAYFGGLLDIHNGSVRKVSAQSGVERTHVYRKLQMLGLRSRRKVGPPNPPITEE